jgi:hypothetical protein
MIRAYRKLLVPIPGSPVRVTSLEPDPDRSQGCHGVLIQALPGNLGKIYIGNANVSKAASTDVYAFLAVPTTNFIPTFSAALTMSPGGIQLRDFWVDADFANEGVVVTILVT